MSVRRGARFGALIVAGAFAACRFVPASDGSAPPRLLLGEFEDDYGIRYAISDSLWHQRPDARYEIARWDAPGQTLVARNGAENPSDAGRWTRIDWVELDGMEPYLWGFCLTRYDALTRAEAEAATAADRSSPRDGCGGFPFSRMKRVEALSPED